MEESRGIAVFAPKARIFGIVRKDWVAKGRELDPLNEVQWRQYSTNDVPKEGLVPLFMVAVKGNISGHDVCRLPKDWDEELKTALMDRQCNADKQNTEIQTAQAAIISDFQQQISDLQKRVANLEKEKQDKLQLPAAP